MFSVMDLPLSFCSTRLRGREEDIQNGRLAGSRNTGSPCTEEAQAGPEDGRSNAQCVSQATF